MSPIGRRLGRARNRAAEPAGEPDGTIVVVAGNRWDGMASSDRHLATQLAQHRPVLYIDPPERGLPGRSVITTVAPGVRRVVPMVPPGAYRPGLRLVTPHLIALAARRALAGRRAAAVIVAAPLPVLHLVPAQRRVLYATDDWVAGAGLMRLPADRLRAVERCHARTADVVVTVSDALAAKYRDLGHRDVHVVPNGCDVERLRDVDAAPLPSDVDLPAPIAGLVGNLSERIDLGLLEAVAERGTSLLLVGPRRGDFGGERFDRLVGRTNVCWVGERSYDALLGYLRLIDVGLTPYADSTFNVASSPLKTIEYLAAGRGSVASDLPGIRALDLPAIRLASGRDEFAAAVAEELAVERTPAVAEARRAVAAPHGWDRRAEAVLALIEGDGHAMKVLVYPHDLALGGSQINAIDIAARLAAHGHEVVTYGLEGPLVEYIAGKGLEFVPAPTSAVRPAPSRIRHLAETARRRGIEVIHAYEWPPCLDAYYGAHRRDGVALLCTVLSMAVSPLVPTTVPLLMGTEEPADLARAARHGGGAPVGVFEPPIDTDLDHPTNDGTAFRGQLGIDADELAIVSVCRLSYDLKFDALVDALGAASALASSRIRLVLVGDGDAAPEIRRRAAEVNERAGRDLVVLPGALLDPRPAYAAADVVVAMGSSALRAMAHARPVVVQGERGWSLPCTPDTASVFLHQGFYGLGDGTPGGDRLAAHLAPLLTSAAARQQVGAWSRALVEERFSLTAATSRVLETIDALRHDPSVRPGRLTAVRATAATTARAVVHEAAYHLPLGPLRVPLERASGLTLPRRS